MPKIQVSQSCLGCHAVLLTPSSSHSPSSEKKISSKVSIQAALKWLNGRIANAVVVVRPTPLVSVHGQSSSSGFYGEKPPGTARVKFRHANYATNRATIKTTVVSLSGATTVKILGSPRNTMNSFCLGEMATVINQHHSTAQYQILLRRGYQTLLTCHGCRTTCVPMEGRRSSWIHAAT